MTTEFLALRKTPIVGVYFRPPEVKALVPSLNESTVLILEREPENPYDNLAVKVCLEDGTHIGYIPATINPLISMFMANGHTTRVELTKPDKQKPEISVWVVRP